MTSGDLICPACDGRIADVVPDFVLARPETSQAQVMYARCTGGHPLRVAWTAERVEVVARKEGATAC